MKKSKIWKVFSCAGVEFGRYTVKEEFEGEEGDTKKRLAFIHGVSEKDICVRLEER